MIGLVIEPRAKASGAINAAPTGPLWSEMSIESRLYLSQSLLEKIASVQTRENQNDLCAC